MAQQPANAPAPDPKKAEIMAFLHQHVFDPILQSRNASSRLKQGVRLTVMRMNERDAAGALSYYWSAVCGTDHSVRFADDMRREGFTRFEDREVLEEFRRRFDDKWLRS